MRPNYRRNEVSGAGYAVSLVFTGLFVFGLGCCTAEVYQAAETHRASRLARVECADTYDPGECYRDRLEGEASEVER
jgi:hypothetical protein